MGAIQRFLAILRADLRERTRSPRFWILLLAMVAATWRCFPPVEASYMVVAIDGNARGAYSSAWVGMVLAMVYSSMLSLFGFYLVRGTLSRDFDTRVWQLLVATPMTRGGYLLAKWASHMAVFALVVVAGLAVALIAQWLRAEDRAIDLLELVKPVLLLNVPGLAVTAAIAIWFDLVPWLRRTAGNVLFFIVWLTITSVSVARLDTPGSSVATGWRSDPNGLVMVARDFHRVREQQTGLPQKFGFTIGNARRRDTLVLFDWKHWNVRPMDVLGRSLWLIAALAGVLLGAPLLDWAAARGTQSARGGAGPGLRLRWLDRISEPFSRGPVGTLAVAELRLALRQRRGWWWLLLLIAFGLQLFGEGKGLQSGLLLALLLPIDILARGGLRESEHRTAAMVFAAPDILKRLLAARLATGSVLLLALTLPGTLRLAADYPMAPLASLLVAASISAWGLAIGALSRHSRPFELMLVIAAYIAFQGVGLFDLGGGAHATALWHGAALLPAMLVLAWSWPRLARC